MGVTVRFGVDMQQMLVNKYSPPQKIMRTSNLLACHESGHNACLPRCILPKSSQADLCASSSECNKHGFDPTRSCHACIAAPVAECEFPDRFVEIDVFS